MKLKLILSQFYNIVHILFFLSVINTTTLDTALGQCKIRIFNNDHHSSLIEKTIIEYSEEVISKFGNIAPTSYSINITSNIKEFQKETYGRAPEWSIAITMKKPNKIVMQSPSTAKISFKKLLQVLVHELNHIYLNNVLNSYSFPSWFKEGMAVSESGEFSINDRILISSAKWKNELLSINQLNRFSNINKYNSHLAYAESYAMFIALQHYYGIDIYKKIITVMNQGYTFWDALTYITNEDENLIKNNIEQFLLKNYNWMFLLNAYNLIFIFLPIIVIGGYFYKKYKNRKLLKKWEIEELLEDLHSNEEPN